MFVPYSFLCESIAHRGHAFFNLFINILFQLVVVSCSLYSVYPLLTRVMPIFISLQLVLVPYSLFCVCPLLTGVMPFIDCLPSLHNNRCLFRFKAVKRLLVLHCSMSYIFSSLVVNETIGGILKIDVMVTDAT